MRQNARAMLVFTLATMFLWSSTAAADRPSVLVDPHVQGNGTATTIQGGIDMVGPGGKVMVLPGTYEETLVIDKRGRVAATDRGPVDDAFFRQKVLPLLKERA